MADNMVLTYRATQDGMKVGQDIRSFGELIPEAKQWENLSTYLRAGYVEKVYLSQEEYEAEWAPIQKRIDNLNKPKEKKPAKKTTAKRAVKIKKKEESNGERLAEQSV